jgi:hypothetical protein
MKRSVGLALAAALLVGCAPSPPQPAAERVRASTQLQPAAHGYLDGMRWTEHAGAPTLPWPKFQSGQAARANEAELAIILRAHELRERHPGATHDELAEMLARDEVWEQNAKFVPSLRRTAVVREALVLW